MVPTEHTKLSTIYCRLVAQLWAADCHTLLTAQGRTSGAGCAARLSQSSGRSSVGVKRESFGFQPALFAKAEKASSTSSVPRPLYSFSQPSKPGYRASRQSRPSMLESSAQTKIFGSPPTFSFEVNALTEWYAPPAGSNH